VNTAVARAVQNDFAERDTVLFVPGTLKMEAHDFAKLMERKDGSRTGIIAQNVEIVPMQKQAACTEHRGQAVDDEGRCAICGGVRTKVTASDVGATLWNWWNAT
jgi:hypothetical protein